MNASNRSTNLLVLIGSSLLVAGIVAWIVLLGNQQGLQESVIALNASQPTEGFLGKSVFESVWDAPLFSNLLALLQGVPWLAQGLWLVGLVFGFFAVEAIGKLVLSPSSERRLFLGLVLLASFWGYWQVSAINFQTYTALGVGLFCWLLMAWFKVKTAPIKGDTLPRWQPNGWDVCLGATLALMTYEWGIGLSLFLLGGLLFRHQQVSTVLPATWQMRSVSLLRWLWIGLLVGLLVECLCLHFWGGGISPFPPLLRVPPLLPEWTGWQSGFSSTGLRLTSLLGAFFPWGFFLLSALWDLWLNVQKGGSKASLFLDPDRKPLRLLSLAGLVFGAIWLVFPAFWLGWGVFLFSHAYLLADWLTAACTLPVDPLRFKRGFLWSSLLLLALGLAGLIWENHAASFQLSTSPLQLQAVQTIHSLWCVLGGCLGLLVLWRSTLNPKYCSLGLASWFGVWMLIQTIGVTPLLAWQGGSQADIAPFLGGNQPETVGVCLNQQALQQGTFYTLAGRGTFSSTQKNVSLTPLSVTSCLALEAGVEPSTPPFHWVLMNDTLYYEHKHAHPQWQSPVMGINLSHFKPAFTPVAPSLVQPVLLPFMVPQQETWVLIPVDSQLKD